MPYRNVYIGDGETVVARVPKEVVDEWLENRSRNKTLGYPDRPPDIDTALLRTWVSHPTEKAFMEELAKRNKVHEKGETFPLYSVAIQWQGIEAKVLITFEADKGYCYRLVAREVYSGHSVHDKEVYTKEWSESTFISLLGIYHDLFIDGNTDPPFITTYFDFMALEDEIDLVYTELKDFYGLDYDYPTGTIDTD